MGKKIPDATAGVKTLISALVAPQPTSGEAALGCPAEQSSAKKLPDNYLRTRADLVLEPQLRAPKFLG